MTQEPREDSGPGGSKWTCAGCGEVHEPSFEACWNCGTARGGPPAPQIPAPPDPDPSALRYCLACAYLLRGLGEDRCPECGRGFDPRDPTTFRSAPGETPSKTFDLLRHPRLGHHAVKRGFSWPGFFFGMIWAFIKELWVVGLLLFIAVSVLQEAGQRARELATLVLGLQMGVSLFVGFRGNQWRIAALTRRGYEHVRTVRAQTPAGAVFALEGSHGERPAWRPPHQVRRVLVSILLMAGLSVAWETMVAPGLGPTPAERRAQAQQDRLMQRRNATVPPRTSPPRRQPPVRSPSSPSQTPLERSLATHTRAIQRNPDDAGGYHRRGHVYEKMNEWKKAATDFGEAVERAPDNTHLQTILVDAWLAAGEPVEAKAALDAYADHLLAKGESGWPLNNLAWRYVTESPELRDPAKALPLVEKAIGLDPDNTSWLNTLGVVYYRLGRLEEAIDVLVRTDAAHEGDAEDVVFLALCHHGLGDDEAARAQADRLPAIMRPRSTDEQRSFGNELVTELRAAVSKAPENATLQAALASALFATDARDAAVAAYTAAIELAPADPMARLLRGQVHAAEARWDEAVRDCSEAIRLGVPTIAAWLHRARARAALGDGDAADDYRRVLTRLEDDRAALMFDGVDDDATVPFIPLDGFDTLTLEAWVLGWTGPIVAQGAAGDPENSIWLSAGGGVGDSIEACGWESGRGKNDEFRLGELLTPRWTHLAMVYDGKQQLVFVDGKLVNRVNATKPGPLTPTRSLRIGAFEASPPRHGAGLLGALRISNTARYEAAFSPAPELIADERTLLLLDANDSPDSTWRDRSGHDRHAALNGGSHVAPE